MSEEDGSLFCWEDTRTRGNRFRIFANGAGGLTIHHVMDRCDDSLDSLSALSASEAIQLRDYLKQWFSSERAELEHLIMAQNPGSVKYCEGDIVDRLRQASQSGEAELKLSAALEIERLRGVIVAVTAGPDASKIFHGLRQWQLPVSSPEPN